ncbi:sugar nucleotide-binding protein [Halomarina ordinaria]|uniref:Sugar nucleotide-binding protein n=1 Tax=Halomarina ordinaria TaxID=3033939 RepID=A0ABD5U851_9EURY|nr:sugar nucleotide-binding protein [Halomarina sp. PSRA2]
MSAPVLVVGASGYLGRSVVDALRERGVSTVGTYHRNRRPGASVGYDFFEDDPTVLPLEGCETVVFAAHVERTSHDRERFDAALSRLLRACTGTRFVYASSVGVFDGETGGYVESDPPNPKSRYGRRLAAFERRVADALDGCILRFDYLFGSSRGTLDDRLAHTRERLRAGETVEYYADMFKSPVAVSDAARTVATVVSEEVDGVVHVPTPRTSVFAFHRAAMAALGLPYRRVRPTTMPDDPVLHRDTSLRSERFAEHVGFRPRSVRRAMQDARTALRV